MALGGGGLPRDRTLTCVTPVTPDLGPSPLLILPKQQLTEDGWVSEMSLTPRHNLTRVHV